MAYRERSLTERWARTFRWDDAGLVFAAAGETLKGKRLLSAEITIHDVINVDGPTGEKYFYITIEFEDSPNNANKKTGLNTK